MRQLFIVVMSLTILVCGDALPIQGAPEPTVTIPTGELIQAIKNHDVEWDGTPAGLIPHWHGATFLVAKYGGQDVSDQLVAALDDPDRFVSAHVLLAGRLLKEVSLSGGTYDHLQVTLWANGSTTIDPAQRGKLKKMWTERLKKRADGSRDPSLR
jgi:hypothetical protein